MAESIRSLTVKLGYDVDTTGADIFKARFKTLAADAKRTADILERAFKPKTKGKVTKGPLEQRIDRLNRKIKIFKRNLARSFKIDKGIQKDLKFAGDKLKAGFDNLKVIALAGAAAIAAASVKVFTNFADIQQAKLTLAFRTSESQASSFIEKIGKITKETGGLVTQLDAINAVSFGGNITDQTQFFVDNLSKIIKLSKVAGIDFREASDAIARFIETGSGLDDLVKFEIISATQKEAIVKSKSQGAIGAQGIASRTSQVGGFLREGAPRVDTFFEKFTKTGNATIDKLKANAEELTVLVGEKLNPSVNSYVTTIINGISLLRKAINTSSFDPLTGGPKLVGPTGSGSGSDGNNSNTFNINVKADGNEDISNKVVKEIKKMGRGIIINQSRRAVPQSLNTTKQVPVN